MKKNFKYAILSAIALVGAVSFSACSSNEEIVDNPDYNPVDNTVKTQLAFSLSKGGANKVTTRQTAAIVQDGQNHSAFRGMTKMSLIPFGGTIGATSSPLGPVIGPLTMDLSSTPSSTVSSYNNDNNDAVVYTNIQVPNNTSNFLFYGQATEGTGTDNHDNGTLAVTGLYGTSEGTYNFTTLNNISFAPVSIYDANNTTAIGVGGSLVALLNSLLTVTDGASTPKTWGDYTATDNALLNGLYTNYIKLTTASSYSVAAMLVDLYSSLEGLANTADGTAGKAMATNLRTAIAAGFTGSVAEANITAAGYPGNLGLPDGAAKLEFDAATGFSLVADPNTGNFPTGASITKYNDYVYPANLQYFVNSPIKVSNIQQSTQFAGKTSWTACTDLYTNGTVVASTTKSIALTNEIQYGVGNLKTVVNALISGATYYDRNAEAIDITTATTPFTLTGVLVGSQGSVGWNFVPASVGSMTIYDNRINSAPLSTSASPNNFTLGLETVEVPATPDGTTGVVYIALELRNDTGKDFMGKDGLIPAGGKFYLAGKLDPSVTANISANTDNVKSVYKQDYLTIAELTIGQGTLKYSNGTDQPTDPTDPTDVPVSADGGFAEATNGIPDLRTPQTEVCFSVNLQWKSGIVFNITF